MTEIFNKQKFQERRRKLRHEMTKAEAILWTHIKNRQVENQRFLRQFSINYNVVDFYCPKLRIIIEVDGPTHLSDEDIEYDKLRQTELENLGLYFLRFTNEEIYENILYVVERIRFKILGFMQNPPTPSASRAGQALSKRGDKSEKIKKYFLYEKGDLEGFKKHAEPPCPPFAKGGQKV